jgi:hypothetical protein
MRAVLVDRTGTHRLTALPPGVARLVTLNELPELILEAKT